MAVDLIWAFRVASRLEAGGGHVTRCLSLARALGNFGHRAQFIIDDAGLRWERYIRDEGHDCVTASSRGTKAVIGCVIDGYDFDARTIDFWRRRAAVMVAILDFQPLPDWADLVIAPAMAPAAEGLHLRTLKGLEFALVNGPIAQKKPRDISREVRNVLVTFGQRDSRNATGLALNALELLLKASSPINRVTVALGGSAPHLRDVESHVARISGATLTIDAEMSTLYDAADLVIGGGGVGLLERLSRGLPSVSIALADNQLRQIERCAEMGGTLNARQFENLSADRLAMLVVPLMKSYESRLIMSTKGREAVDGLGASRCAQAMVDLACMGSIGGPN